MLTYAFFLSNRRESLVRAFRKKTPLSVRRPGGGGLRGGRKGSIETELFFDDGFPNQGNSFLFIPPCTTKVLWIAAGDHIKHCVPASVCFSSFLVQTGRKLKASFVVYRSNGPYIKQTAISCSNSCQTKFPFFQFRKTYLHIDRMISKTFSFDQTVNSTNFVCRISSVYWHPD